MQGVCVCALCVHTRQQQLSINEETLNNNSSSTTFKEKHLLVMEMRRFLSTDLENISA